MSPSFACSQCIDSSCRYTHALVGAWWPLLRTQATSFSCEVIGVISSHVITKRVFLQRWVRMRVYTEAATSTCLWVGCGSELRLSNNRAWSRWWRRVSKVRRRSKRLRRWKYARGGRRSSSIAWSRSHGIGIGVLWIVGIWIRLEPPIDHNARCMDFNKVVFLVSSSTVRRLLTKLGTDIAIQRLSSRVNKFRVVFVENFLRYHCRVFALLREIGL